MTDEELTHSERIIFGGVITVVALTIGGPIIVVLDRLIQPIMQFVVGQPLTNLLESGVLFFLGLTAILSALYIIGFVADKVVE